MQTNPYGSDISVSFNKPGVVEVTAKYKGLTAKTTVKCYEEKIPETLEVPESVKGYKGCNNFFDISFGDDKEVNRDARYELISGEDVISLSGLTGGEKCVFEGLAVGKAVIRVTAEKNENLCKDIVVEVTDEPAPSPTVTISANGKDILVENNSITVEKNADLSFVYSWSAVSLENGYRDFHNMIKQVDKSKILGYGFGGGNGGFGDTLGIGFRTVRVGSETFEISEGKYLTINVVGKNFEKPLDPETPVEPETPSDKPTVETGSAEDTKVEVSDTISKEDAAVITETLSKAEGTSVVSTIKPAAKETLIKELTKDIETTGKEVSLAVVNTVKVTAADLKSEKKSITYEISPKAVVTVDGVVVNTADLKNDQLTGKKDIEVTLPINGLDLKEIVHKSEGYDPEYIYDFVVSKEGTVTFKISHFSSFTLNEAITKPAESSTGTVSPNTGDHTDIMLYGGLGVAAMIGVVALILFRRKHA